MRAQHCPQRRRRRSQHPRSPPSPHAHLTDCTPRESSLCAAVASMASGERAAVYVTDPAYGYGASGSFSFPAVPPGAELVYDVTLCAWEPPDEVCLCVRLDVGAALCC